MSIDYSNFAFPKNPKKQDKEITRLRNKSSKLTKMERNRTSILTDNMKKCYICSAKATDIHEVFRGRNRQKSIKWQLVVPLCRKCHDLVTTNKKASEELLEKQAKKEFIKLYSKEKFIEEFK